MLISTLPNWVMSLWLNLYQVRIHTGFYCYMEMVRFFKITPKPTKGNLKNVEHMLKGSIARDPSRGQSLGMFHLTKILWKFWFKVEWNRKFLKSVSKMLVNFLRLSFFPVISCSICHFYLVWIGPSPLFRKFSSSKMHKMVASLQNDLPLFEPVFDCLSSTKTLGSDFWKLWTGCCEFPVCIHPVFINLP